MKSHIKFCLVFFVLQCFAGAKVFAQQGNLQLLLTPSVDIYRVKTRDIAAAYTDAHGSRVNLSGLDVTVTFGTRRSSATYDSTAFGAALQGLPNSERIYIDGVRRDVAGISFHGGTSRHYLYGRDGELPRRTLFVSVPVSFGSYSVIKGSKEEGRFYDVLAGFQCGAALNLRAGNWLAAPSAMLGAMGGYKEKYKGGTYWKNMSSGGVRPFGVAALGLELAYLPVEMRLRTLWQRSFSNGAERAVDYVSWQFMLGWGAVH